MRGKFNMQSGAINGPLATQKVPDVSQGSVATRLMCDGVFSDDFVIFTYLLTYLRLLLSLVFAVKEFRNRSFLSKLHRQ